MNSPLHDPGTAVAAPPAGDPAALDACALLQRLADGSLTSLALCEHLLQRSRAHRSLNAFSWLDENAVLQQAHAADRARAQGGPAGALAGLPIAVKDNIHTLGYPTSAGTRVLQALQPQANAPVWQRLAEAGAVLFGKTNMHELACGGTSSNPVFGAVRNPRAPGRIPGGSSGGAAAAVAAHLVPAALGTDTSGSVRMPAALCGIAGLRPSTGRQRAYPGAGVLPLVGFIDTIGPMARSVRDLALLHGAVSGRGAAPVPAAGTLRLGLPTEPFWQDLQPEVREACGAATEALGRAGVTLVPVDLGALAERATTLQRQLGAACRLHDLQAFLQAEPAAPSLERLLAGIASDDVRTIYGLPVPAEPRFDALLQTFDALLAETLAVLDRAGIDALLYPTAPVTAPWIRAGGDRFGDSFEHNGRTLDTSATTARHTRFAAGLGLPALSLPCPAPGLPVGLELCGRPGRDAELLALAACLEPLLAGAR